MDTEKRPIRIGNDRDWFIFPNRGTKLAAFAARCIENEMLMHLRSLGSEADDVIKEVDLKIEKRAPMKLYHDFYKAKR